MRRLGCGSHECSIRKAAIALLLGLFVHTAGADTSSLRSQAQPLVNSRLDELEAGSVAAKLAGSRQRAVAGLLRSRGAKARASALEMRAQQLVMQSQTKTAVLEDMFSQAENQAAKADMEAGETEKKFKGMKAKADGMPKQAKDLAVLAVQKLLESKFDDLQGWRENVLRDTHAQAQLKVAEAIQPYRKSRYFFLKRMQTFASQAKAVALQANEAVAKSGEIAKEAERKQEGGDSIGAKQDIELARAMMRQGQQLRENAEALQASAEDMNRQSGLYISARNMAIARARYDADPNAMPPLSVDPNTAYTPPPPMGR